MTDVEIISELIGQIYDAALDPVLWPAALERTCGFIGGAAAGLFSKNPADSKGNKFYSWGDDPYYTRLYFEKYVRLDPFTIAEFFFDIGDVISIESVMPYKEYRETAVFKEWVEPQGYVDVASAVLDKSGSSYAAISLMRHRRHGLVDAETRRRLALLAPHLRRSVLIGNVINLGDTGNAGLIGTLDGLSAAVFLVDADANIAFANLAGHALCREGRILRNSRGILTSVDVQADRQLKDTFAVAQNGDTAVGNRGIAVLLSATHDERWIAHVLPLTSGSRQHAELPCAVAAVFVRQAKLDVPSPTEVLAKAYKLTPSELRVLQAFLQGGAIAAIAKALGLSEPTVKTHLQHLYEKTGTHRQADLVKLVAAHASPFAT